MLLRIPSDALNLLRRQLDLTTWIVLPRDLTLTELLPELRSDGEVLLALLALLRLHPAEASEPAPSMARQGFAKEKRLAAG